jgi:hypothetical protein
VDETGSGSCPVAGLDINNIEIWVLRTGVRFEAFTDVVRKSFAFWDKTPCTIFRECDCALHFPVSVVFAFAMPGPDCRRASNSRNIADAVFAVASQFNADLLSAVYFNG